MANPGNLLGHLQRGGGTQAMRAGRNLLMLGTGTAVGPGQWSRRDWEDWYRERR